MSFAEGQAPVEDDDVVVSAGVSSVVVEAGSETVTVSVLDGSIDIIVVVEGSWLELRQSAIYSPS